MNEEEQHRQVYAGIVAVASHCDGALTDDGVGFNGQDTKFGRRIASVPFDLWTDDIKEEAARIALTYRVQILTYTGVDMSSLPVVRSASGLSTNRVARSEALGFERQAQNAGLKVERKIDVVPVHGDPLLSINWAKRDRDFNAILAEVRAFPKRTWNGQTWVVPNFEGLKDFIDRWDFNVTEMASALIDKPAPVHYDITLQDNGQRVTIERPYHPEEVAAIQQLPGRAYAGGNFNHADASPLVLALAARFGFKVHPAAVAACEKAAKAYQAAAQADLDASDRQALNVHLSRLRRPEDLPDVVQEILKGILS